MPDNTPKWAPGPYCFEHVAYFAGIPGLKNGTFEINDQGRTDNWLGQTLTIEQAQLFTAAPDLYAALKYLLDVAEVYAPTDSWGMPAMNQARAALAKARGEQTDAR